MLVKLDVCADLTLLEVKVSIGFSGMEGFPPPMEGRYSLLHRIPICIHTQSKPNLLQPQCPRAILQTSVKSHYQLYKCTTVLLRPHHPHSLAAEGREGVSLPKSSLWSVPVALQSLKFSSVSSPFQSRQQKRHNE